MCLFPCSQGKWSWLLRLWFKHEVSPVHVVYNATCVLKDVPVRSHAFRLTWSFLKPPRLPQRGTARLQWLLPGTSHTRAEKEVSLALTPSEFL